MGLRKISVFAVLMLSAFSMACASNDESDLLQLQATVLALSLEEKIQQPLPTYTPLPTYIPVLPPTPETIFVEVPIEVIKEIELAPEIVERVVVEEVEVIKEVEVEVIKEVPVEVVKEAETKEKHQRYSIASNPTHPLSQTYHDYEIGFSISYPEQWDLVEQNERDVPEWVIPDIELRNPHGGFIRIEGQKMEGVTLRNFTSDRITNDRNFVAETTEHIEKIPADLTTGIYSRSGEPAQILTAVIDPWVLSIVFINESSSKDEQSTTFMEIIESMEIR